jgi:hypothetical protein
MKFAPIKGSAVAPQGIYSASERLQRYLVDVYHRVGGQGGNQGCGPATYTLMFYWLGVGKSIRTGHTELDAYQVIMAQRAGAEEWERSQQIEQNAQQFEPVPPMPGQPRLPPQPRYAPPQQQTHQPPQYAPPQAAPAGVDPALYQRLGYLERVEEEMRRAAAENRAPVMVEPPPPPPPPPPLAQVDTGKQIAEAVTAALGAALAAAGIRPKTETDRLQEMISANNEIMLKNIIALLPPQPAVGAAGNPVPPPPIVVQPQDNVKTAAQTLKHMADEFRAMDKIKEDLRAVIGVDEDDERPVTPQQVIVEQPKPQGFFDKAVSFMKAMPPGALPAVMAGAAAAFEGSPAGNLLNKAAEAAKAAGAAASVAQSVSTSRGTGWGTPQQGQ